MKGLFLIASILVMFACTSQPAAAQTTMTWTVDGENRAALVYQPAPTTSAIKHPLVFAFHGHGGNMQGTSQLMHIQTVWPEAIVVYPQGLNRPSTHDPQGTRSGWQMEANQANIGNKDLDFFDAMLATMQQNYSVDSARIYATGFSNGAGFSYLLWAERGKTLAAIGECAGRLSPAEHLSVPRALLAIAGQADTTNPFAVQQQTIEIARQADSATVAGQTCGPICQFYVSSTQTPVKTLIHPGGHVYPPWAPAQIVKFFKAHKQV